MTKFRIGIIGVATALVASVIMLAPGGVSNAVASLSGPQGTLVAFGDSVSAGEGNSPPAMPGPTGVSATRRGSGGTLGAGRYSYEVTAVESGGGETLPSALESATVTGRRGSVALTWNSEAGAISYDVYGRTYSSTDQNALGLIAAGVVSSSSTVEYVDIGRPSPGTPPPGAYQGFSHGSFLDSPNAYPALLGSDDQFTVDNFSISGACADHGLPNCGAGRPTVESELSQAKAMNLDPSVVTLTVGGNDINFEGCFETLLSVAPSAPCSDTKSDLSTIQKNVTKLLTNIGTLYPGVPIILTLYYDPLPPNFTSITNKNSPCSNESLIYALHQGIQQGNWAEAAKTYVTGNVGTGGKNYFNGIFSGASSIETNLTNALQAAAAAAVKGGTDVQTVALDFSTHDFCEDYPSGNTGWVFGPQIFLFAEVAGQVSRTFAYNPTDTCAVFDAGCQAIAKTQSGRGYSATYIIGDNDFPHPTAAGQEQIAEQITSQLGL